MTTNKNLKKVVITGGAGFIGSNLTKKLIDNDAEKILIIDDFSTGKMSNIERFLDDDKISLIDKRVEDCDDLDILISGYDFCFHLAAGVGVQYIMDNVSKALLTNIEGTHKIIESCKKNNIPLLITSTSEVYGVSNDPVWTEETKSLIGPPTKLRWSYAASKLIDEFLALSEYNDGNLNPIVVRLFNIIGPNQLSEFGMVVPKFIEAALKNEDIVIHGEGLQTRSFTWVGDVVNYFYLLAEKQLYGEIFNIGQTEEISIKDLASMIIKETGSHSKIVFKDHEEIYGNKFEDPMRRTPSIDKIVKATGYMPSMAISDMVKEIIKYNKYGELAGLVFQQEMEKMAWEAGGKTQAAPAQRMVDFNIGKLSNTLNDCSYIPGINSAPLHELLPSMISNRLQEGFMIFGRKMKGYFTNEANILGVESRTSSPVRIPRDKVLLSHPQIKNLYPCGEGAGYAGGIVSAAIDGERCADAIHRSLA